MAKKRTSALYPTITPGIGGTPTKTTPGVPLPGGEYAPTKTTPGAPLPSGDLGFPGSEEERKEWLKMGRIWSGGKWNEPAPTTTTPGIPKPTVKPTPSVPAPTPTPVPSPEPAPVPTDDIFAGFPEYSQMKTLKITTTPEGFKILQIQEGGTYAYGGITYTRYAVQSPTGEFISDTKVGTIMETGLYENQASAEAMLKRRLEDMRIRGEMGEAPSPLAVMMKPTTPIKEEPIDLGLEDEEEPTVITSDETETKEKEDETKKKEEETKEIENTQVEIEKLTAQQQLKNLRAELDLPEIDPETGIEKPERPDYETMWEALRDAKGVGALESRLTSINSQLRDMEASLRLGLQKIEGELAPMEILGQERLELRRQGQEQLDNLRREKATLVEELNMEYSIIETQMNFKEMSFNDAKEEYNRDFNINLKLLDILEGRETAEQKETNMEKDAATANWQVMSNMIEDSLRDGTISSYDDLSTDVKTTIRKLELVQGLPEGFTSQVLANVNPAKKIKTTIVSKDKTNISYIYEDGSSEVFRTGLTAEAGVGGIGEPNGAGAGFTDDEGNEFDMTNTEGLKSFKEKYPKYTYEDMNAWYDVNMKSMDASTRKGLLEGAGYMSIKKTEEKTEEKEETISFVKYEIEDYKKEWKEGGDKGAGTREEFGKKIHKYLPILTLDEIMGIIYEEVSDEWLEENKKGHWWNPFD